jgi:hypothetical protein
MASSPWSRSETLKIGVGSWLPPGIASGVGMIDVTTSFTTHTQARFLISIYFPTSSICGTIAFPEILTIGLREDAKSIV